MSNAGLVALFLTTLTASVCAQSLRDGVVAHWRFDGDNTDSSGGGNDLEGPTSADAFGPGVIGRAAWFVRGDRRDTRHRELVDSPRLAQLGRSFSVSLWLLPATDEYGDKEKFAVQALVSAWGEDGNQRSFDVSWRTYDGRIAFSVSGDGAGQSKQARTTQSPAADNNQLWHHVVVVVDLDAGDGYESRVYIASQRDPATTMIGASDLDYATIHAPSGGTFTIGSADNGGFTIQEFEGLIDDVIVYDHALSEKQINELLRLGQSGQTIRANTTTE